MPSTTLLHGASPACCWPAAGLLLACCWPAAGCLVVRACLRPSACGTTPPRGVVPHELPLSRTGEIGMAKHSRPRSTRHVSNRWRSPKSLFVSAEHRSTSLSPSGCPSGPSAAGKPCFGCQALLADTGTPSRPGFFPCQHFALCCPDRPNRSPGMVHSPESPSVKGCGR